MTLLNKKNFFYTVFFSLFFLAPNLILIYFFKRDLLKIQNLLSDDFYWALKNSLIQAFSSATLCTILAIPLSLGLFTATPKVAQILKRLLVLPVVLPSLFTILICMTLFDPLPTGSLGISIVCSVVYLGFVTLLLHSGVIDSLGQLAVISEIFGIGRARFIFKIYFPLMKKKLATAFLTAFVFCFTSFSIPLVVGGGKDANLELLIYESIFIEQNWSKAFVLGLFQTIFIFLLSFYFLREKKQIYGLSHFLAGSYLKSKIGWILVLLYVGAYFGTYFIQIIKALGSWSFISTYQIEIYTVTVFSVKVLFMYLISQFILLYFWLSDYISNRKFNFIGHLISPSTAVVGFSVYLFLPFQSSWDEFKIILAITLIGFPSFFKFFLQESIENLKNQTDTALIYGISKNRIIFDLYLRQIKPQLQLWIFFMCICFLGDYAIIKSIGIRTQTLGLLTESLMSSYRLSAAYILSFYSFILCSLFYVVIHFLIRGSYVVYKKFNL